jgi:hypothetical protein
VREKLVVSDSGPLIALARIDRLALLPELMESIVVPPAVFAEVTADRDLPGAQAVLAAPWIRVVPVLQPSAVDLNIVLGEGESQAIQLAASTPGALLLVDDGRARLVAERLGLRLTGTMGVLIRARRAGLITALRPEVEGLRRHGIHIAPALVEAVLRQMGET